jgi:HAMP domain-containing protein
VPRAVRAGGRRDPPTDRPFPFKALPSAPFRLNVRPNNSQATEPLSPREGAAPEGASREAAPGSHLARRRGSDARLEAVPGKRREESGPPTKPSIAPPSPRPNPRPSALGEASPLLQLERATPTLTYNLVIVLATAAVGLGGLMAAWSSGRQGGSWFTGTLLFIAVSTLIFSASMAVLITLSFTRRLRVLAESAWRLAHGKSELPIASPSKDALTTLAQSLTKMAERIVTVTSELEQAVEEEQARVDELVRERVRTLAREAEDYRRMVGESRGLLTLDHAGRVVAQSSVLEAWLGAMPRSVQFWQYLERASIGLGPRFETAWARAVQERATEPDLTAMPTSLVVGQRHFALEYKGVLDAEGKLDRVLVLVTDVTIPSPDPATTTRAPG